MTLHAKLAEIQQNLNAPKGQHNSFGGYKYRSCEDILGAVKPLLSGLVITVSDDVVLIGTRTYIKATARITDGKESIETTSYAREAESKKGMDDSQVTGSASSYARKYALNGLLLIDDVKDADTMDNSDGGNASKPAAAANTEPDGDTLDAEIIAKMNAANSVPDLVKVMNGLKGDAKRAATGHFNQRMSELKKAA